MLTPQFSIIKCEEQHNAQVANINLVPGRRGLKAASFTTFSRFAIYANGPHGAGNLISYNLWIKTTQSGEMVLVHFGSLWGEASKPALHNKDILLLTLNNGSPNLYIGPNDKLIPSANLYLNDGNWHHLSVSMPQKSSLLSEVTMFVDGNYLAAYTPPGSEDRHIFHHTGGTLSLGGFGYSTNYEVVFPGMKPYTGLMDDFRLYGKPITASALKWMTAPNFIIKYETSCDEITPKRKILKAGLENCKKKCSKKKWCEGFGFVGGGLRQCTLYDQKPDFGEKKSKHTCSVKMM